MLHRQDEEGGRGAQGGGPGAQHGLQDGQEVHVSKRWMSLEDGNAVVAS